MDKDKIVNYILSRREVELPALQKDLVIGYAEAKSNIDELVKAGKLEYVSGVKYKTIGTFVPGDGESVYKPANPLEALSIKALWACINFEGVSVAAIQRKLAVSFADATAAVGWMERNGFVSPRPLLKLLITRDEFIKKFGDLDAGADVPPRPTVSRVKSELDKARELWKYLNADDDKKSGESGLSDVNIDIPVADPVTDDEDEDYDDEDDDDEDDDDDFNFEGYEFDEDGCVIIGDDDSGTDIKSILKESTALSLAELSNGNTCIMNLDGEPEYELKFIRNGRAVTISDRGATVGATKLTRRRVLNILKSRAPVELNGDAIEITVENPSGLLMGLMRFYAALDAIRRAE